MPAKTRLEFNPFESISVKKLTYYVCWNFVIYSF